MFRNFITEHNLIEKNDKILIAFSGGPDSVYLLERLLEIKNEYNLEIFLGYVNHNFRDDVYKDITLVKNIANKYNLEYKILDIHLERFSEEKAREYRYKVLNDLMIEIGYDKIATGHNKSDNAETIIFNIIRGCGLDGLKGISVKRDNIIRPILYIKKSDILKQVFNDYIVDSTNLENDYSRNKIRNLVFPILNEINNKSIDNITKLYKNITNNYDENYNYIINKLKEFDIELNSNKIEQIYKILNKEESKIINLGNGYYWYKSYDVNKIITKNELDDKCINDTLTIDNEVIYNGYVIGYTSGVRLEKISNKMYNILSLDTFNEDSIFDIRTRNDGDRIGNKKLKKLFIDNKIDKLERDRMPIISYNDEIVMVGDLFKVKNKSSINKYYLYIRRNDGR